MTITEFIGARLAEDEAIANAACPGPWEAVPYIYGPPEDGWGEPQDYEIDSIDGAVVTHQPHEGGGVCGPANAAHIASQDPGRTLRDITAKRAIVADYLDCAKAYRDGSGWPDVMRAARDAHWRALMHLAARWNDHPDYQTEWAPYDRHRLPQGMGT